MNYYFVMDDRANKTFNFHPSYGAFDLNIRKIPFSENNPRSFWQELYKNDTPEIIYYNFFYKRECLKRIDFGYDFYREEGFIISENLFNVLKMFNVQEHICKKVRFTVNGNMINSPDFYFFTFKYPIYDPSISKPKVIDYEKTEQLPSKSDLIVSKKIVLKEDIELDVFELDDLEWLLSSGFVVNEDVKNAIEDNNCGKGIRFLPIETAQVEFCKYAFKDFNDLIKKPKPRLP